MASGEDLRASSRSQHRTIRGCSCEGRARQMQRRHHAAFSLAALLGCSSTATTASTKSVYTSELKNMKDAAVTLTHTMHLSKGRHINTKEAQVYQHSTLY